jgi:hypothetical protein
VARTAALLPCSPADLLDLDLSMFNEVSRQVAHREREWTRRDEMAAQQLEMTHLLWRTLIQVNSAKKVDIPDFHFPRPGEQVEKSTARVASHVEMAAMMMRRPR